MSDFWLVLLGAVATAVVGALGYTSRVLVDRRQRPPIEAAVERAKLEMRDALAALEANIEAAVESARLEARADQAHLVSEVEAAVERGKLEARADQAHLISEVEAAVERARLEARGRLAPSIEAEVELARQRLIDRYRTLTELRNGLRRVDHEFDKLWDEPERADLLESARWQCHSLRELSRACHGLSGSEQNAVINATLAVTNVLISITDLAEEVPWDYLQREDYKDMYESALDSLLPWSIQRMKWERFRMDWDDILERRESYRGHRWNFDLLLDGLGGVVSGRPGQFERIFEAFAAGRTDSKAFAAPELHS